MRGLEFNKLSLSALQFVTIIYKKKEYNIYALKWSKNLSLSELLHFMRMGNMSSDYISISLNSRGRARYKKQGSLKYLPTPIVLLSSALLPVPVAISVPIVSSLLKNSDSLFRSISYCRYWASSNQQHKLESPLILKLILNDVRPKYYLRHWMIV